MAGKEISHFFIVDCRISQSFPAVGDFSVPETGLSQVIEGLRNFSKLMRKVAATFVQTYRVSLIAVRQDTIELACQLGTFNHQRFGKGLKQLMSPLSRKKKTKTFDIETDLLLLSLEQTLCHFPRPPAKRKKLESVRVAKVWIFTSRLFSDVQGLKKLLHVSLRCL